MKIVVSFDVSGAQRGFAALRIAYDRAIEAGITQAARVLLRDCRPYVPMLTGALRDSGHVETMANLKNYAFKLVWDAANVKNNYIYAERQYKEVFQHVDGRYAAKWVERVLKANPDRYTMLAARFIRMELGRHFRGSL